MSAVPMIHGATPRAALRADIVLLGVGSIGRELLGQFRATQGGLAGGLRVCALLDRSGYVFDPDGISRRSLSALCAHKRRGGTLREAPGGLAADSTDAVAFLTACLRGRPILVDATAADTHDILEMVLERGWDVVLANKVPLAAAQARADRLEAVSRASGATILHEATVGAGLPVIDTLRKLIEAGDRVRTIEGCPSGTLGFLFGQLGRGHTFSAALADAIAAGYTEPDPRVDLSGLDVARKALILGRLIGYRGDLASVSVESLVPDALAGIGVDEFLSRAPELDAAWGARVEGARSRGAVLRYRARVTRRSVRVGLAEVPASDPLSLLHGTDNQFSFTTARYKAQPLVITGPGAGPAVTAAGVYNDLLRVVAERGAAALRVPGDAREAGRAGSLMTVS
jgi:aspartokinase/homoserine dehydrogenase 1